MKTPDNNEALFDVVIIGGALAGSSAAILLKRLLPNFRVLVVERSEKHSRKVGEATVEISAYFLCHVLGLTDHLNHKHLGKQGLRFWFANDDTKTLGDCSEIGSRYLVRVPSYQLDRAVLDEEVLRRAAQAGAEILRPAMVEKVGLKAGGLQTITIKHHGTTETVHARWIVDASGFAALLAARTAGGRPTRLTQPQPSGRAGAE
ncbi:MAG: FAD-dependent oxidoreductase [Pedosphaera sp.]|nr:FAD-dependent oxidoreductase [Pedosphaera sp.]